MPALLRASHLGPTLAVTTLTTLFAVRVGRGGGGAVLVCLAVLAGQLSVGWCNDWVDAARDAAVGRPDKPVVHGAVSVDTVRTAAFVALAACVPLSLATSVRGGLLHLAAVGVAWAYDLRLKDTAWSWLPFAVAFGLLPAFVTRGLAGAPWPAWWATFAAACLGVGAHFLNTLPDFEQDARTGVRGLPHRLGARVTAAAGPAVMAVATAAVAAGVARTNGALVALAGPAVAVQVAAGVTSARHQRRVSWPLTMAGAALAVVMLVLGADAAVGSA